MLGRRTLLLLHACALLLRIRHSHLFTLTDIHLLVMLSLIHLLAGLFVSLLHKLMLVCLHVHTFIWALGIVVSLH